MKLVNLIRIIRPIEDAAQEEYIREFFRFIGCLVADLAVDTKIPGDWERCLRADNEENGVDIVLNFYGTDVSRMECAQRGIKRMYLYWELGVDRVELSQNPRKEKSSSQVGDGNSYIQERVLSRLVEKIWKDDIDLGKQKDLLHLCCPIKREESPKDLFYFLQAKRCLQALNTDKILENAVPQKIEIKSGDYLESLLKRLAGIYRALSDTEDPHSMYARINAAFLFWEVVRLLPVSQYELVRNIVHENGKPAIPPVRELLVQAANILQQNRHFVSVWLMMANLYNIEPKTERKAKICYLKALQSVSKNKKEYGFIWYRAGTFCEKAYGDIHRAMRCYRRAAKNDPHCYQAFFRLGYHSMLEGGFKEAEHLLYLAIDALLNGRDPDRNQDKEYPNWQYLSLKEARYIYMVYMLLAKIAINSGREYSARAAVGKACLAATKFEEAQLVRQLENAQSNSSPDREDGQPDKPDKFIQYHGLSQPVWTLWHILEPWSQYIVRDDYVRHVVWVHLDKIYKEREKQWNGG